MRKEKNTTRLNGKDLLNVGIFTAVYFVLNLLVAAVLGLIPAVSMLVPLVSSFILGIPMMLYFMKIKKFGMVLITYIVYGVLLALAGVGIYTLVLGIVFGTDCRVVIAFGKNTRNRIWRFLLLRLPALVQMGMSSLWCWQVQNILKERRLHTDQSICSSCRAISVNGGYFPCLLYQPFLADYWVAC